MRTPPPPRDVFAHIADAKPGPGMPSRRLLTGGWLVEVQPGRLLHCVDEERQGRAAQPLRSSTAQAIEQPRGPGQPLGGGKYQRRIKELLANNPSLDQAEVAAALGLSLSATKKILKSLKPKP